MRPNETADIRKALDRLQQTFEVLNDRYRDLRRERKQLRERIEEIRREREIADAANAAQLERVSTDRGRVAELEQRALQAEQRSQELTLGIDALESALAAREAALAEREEQLLDARAALDAQRQHEEQNWTNEEQLRKEIGSLRQQLAQTQADAEVQQERMGRIVPVEEGYASIPSEELAGMRRELEDLRGMIGKLQGDRSALEEKLLQAIGKLDAATLAEAMARTEVARLEGEKADLEEMLGSLREGQVRYEERLREIDEERRGSLESLAELDALREELLGIRDARTRAEGQLESMTRDLAAAKGALEQREDDLRSLRATLQQSDAAHAVVLASVEENLAAAELDRQRLERMVAELKESAARAASDAESLRERLKSAEGSDDERLLAQRREMDRMSADLGEALDMAARKEMEAVDAARELERLRGRVAELGDELEALRLLAAAGGEEDGVAAGHQPPIDDEERIRITQQIDSAIRLIDRHLASDE